MSVESWLLLVALLAATVLVVVATVLVRGDRPLRWRLVGVFLALALSPALLTVVVVWRELAPKTRLATSEGLERSLGSALMLAREALAEHHAEAETLAARVAARVEAQELAGRNAVVRAAHLDSLRDAPYQAVLFDPAAHEVLAFQGSWTPVQVRLFLESPAVRWPTGPLPTELVPGPDSTWVAVGTRQTGSQAPTADATRPVALVALPVPEAEAILTVVQGMQQAQRLGFLEELKLSTAGRLLAVIAAVYVVVAVTLGVLLARALTRPIERLRRAFEAVAAGELGHQVALGAARQGELSRLLRGFNDMSRELDESKQQLVRTARLAAWQDVARRLAHEIKNPLTPITLSIHRLRGRATADDAVTRECLDTILEETSHLERLANEFSSFARLPKPDLHPLDPAPLLQQVVELYAAHPGVRIHVDAVAPPAVLADRDQLRRVFTNLLKNAVEALPQGGNVEIRWEDAGQRVFVTVLDSGSGFAPQALAHLFDPTFTTKPSGSGLGLAIVQRILEDHGGSITVGNRAEGGAWVRVGLRRAVASEPELV